ncbi:MAG: LPS assembly lipoprotein LptE [Planctomycetaceae bacterium]
MNARCFCLRLLLLLPLMIGCGYTIGTEPIPGASSVHVPIVQSSTQRRGVDYLLTEALQREIRTRGVYRLTEEATADTVLQGRIIEIGKTQLSETRFDDPRELQMSLAAEVTWTDRRTGRVLLERSFPLNRDQIPQFSSAAFAPETGQSLATVQQQLVTDLAVRIADLMEMPW